MNILAFFAHPDDETMLCGGTLALLARAGVDVHYLIATRGEGGEAGEPPLCTREELGAFRERELACAVQALGGRSLALFDYIDPTVGPDNTLYPYTPDPQGLAQELAEFLRLNQIDALITHGTNGEYGHPAHLLTHQSALLAVDLAQMLGHETSLYTVNACFEGHPKPRLANKDDPADWVLDVSPVIEDKIAAAMCHATQHALFIRRPSKELGRTVTVPEVIVSLESLHRKLPPITPGQEDPLGNLLRPWLWKGAS